MHFDSSAQQAPVVTGDWRSLVQRTKQLPLVRVPGRVARLAVRHDGPAVVQSGAAAGHHRIAGVGLGSGDRRPIAEYAGYATMIFMIGWALGRRLLRHAGRSHRPRQDDDVDDPGLLDFHRIELLLGGLWDFSAYRFLTGLGVGGEFAVGVALWPR